MSSLGETSYSSPAPSGYFHPAPAVPPYLPCLPLPPQSQPVHGFTYPTQPSVPYPPYQIPPGSPAFYPPAHRGAFNTNWYHPTPYQPRPFFRGRNPRRGRGQSAQRIHAHYECKVCSKEYKTEENYSAHIQSHQKVMTILVFLSCADNVSFSVANVTLVPFREC